jgi:hypothetical protein
MRAEGDERGGGRQRRDGLDEGGSALTPLRGGQLACGAVLEELSGRRIDLSCLSETEGAQPGPDPCAHAFHRRPIGRWDQALDRQMTHFQEGLADVLSSSISPRMEGFA